MTNIHQRLLPVCALAMAVLLSACAGMQVDPAATDEQALRERAEAYWKLRVEREMTQIYAFEAPHYREEVDLEDYIKIYGGAATTAAEVKGPITIEGDIGKVVVVTTAVFPTMGGRTSPRDDYWQRIDNQWYHLRHRPKPKRK